MRQDNYYSILGIPFHANSIDIKKAYRRKELLYHPDTHHHDEHKAAKFQLVQMAYLTLSNTDKRAEYNRTFFAKQDTIKIKFHHSAEALIESVIKINKSLSSQNQFFINRDWLINECLHSLSEQHQQLFTHNGKLKTLLFKEQAKSFNYLSFKEIKQFENVWIQFAKEDHNLIQSIKVFFNNKKNESLWENNKTLMAILIGAFITFLIMKG
jgi:curved DNA-binding protein CbpA